MKTNTKANQQYQPHPPARSLTANPHLAECPQKWILPIHLQFFPQTTHDVHKAISFIGFFSPTIACFDFFQRSPHALFSFPDDHIQIRDKMLIGDCTALRNSLINCQFMLVTGYTPTKRGCYLDLFFSCTQYFQYWMKWLMSYYMVYINIYS